MPKLYFEFAWSMACFVISRLKRVSNCWGRPINRSLKKSKFSFPLNFVHPILVLTCSISHLYTCLISHLYVHAQSRTGMYMLNLSLIYMLNLTLVYMLNLALVYTCSEFFFYAFSNFSFMHVQSHTRIHLNTCSISYIPYVLFSILYFNWWANILFDCFFCGTYKSLMSSVLLISNLLSIISNSLRDC